MTRRIKKELRQFFSKHYLTESEKIFIMGCIRFQQEHPQLTGNQWKVVCQIEERCKDADSKRHEEITERED